MAGQTLCCYGWPPGAAHGRSALIMCSASRMDRCAGQQKSYKSHPVCYINSCRCADSRKIMVARPLSRGQAVSTFIAVVLDA